MSQVTIPLFPTTYELVVHVFEFLPDPTVFRMALVCKSWYAAAWFVKKANHKKMFERIITVMSPAELAAKGGIQEEDSKKCPCTVIKRLFTVQKKEIDILMSERNQQFRKLIQDDDTKTNDPETFFKTLQNIKDYNIGMALFRSGLFVPDQKGKTYLEWGKETRSALKMGKYDSISSLAFRRVDPADSVFLRDLLSFSNLNLTAFPSELPLFFAAIRKQGLKHLILQQNQLSHLPKEMNLFPDLEILELNWNAFQLFPEPILQLKKLKILDLSENPLTEIPKEIAQLKNLEELNLNETCVTSLPEEIASLENLQEINLLRTSINSFPKEIMDSDKLVHAMVPHLFAELILKLCEQKKEEFYDLICLLPKGCQESIYHDYFTYYEVTSSLHPSREEFMFSLQDPHQNLSEALLIKAFINTMILFHNRTYNPMKHGNTSTIKLFLNAAMQSIAHWSPEEFDKARNTFLSSHETIKKEIKEILASETKEVDVGEIMKDNLIGRVCIDFRSL